MKNPEQQSNMQSYYEDLQKSTEEASLEELRKWIKEIHSEDIEFNEQSFDELLAPVETNTDHEEFDSNSDAGNGIGSGMYRGHNFGGENMVEPNSPLKSNEQQ